MPEVIDRRGLICRQLDPPAGGGTAVATVTGIDFVRVVDPADQRDLDIFFIIDPDKVSHPTPPATMAVAAALPQAFAGGVSAVAAGGGAPGQKLVADGAQSEFRQILEGGQNRVVLRVHFPEPGGFASYRLHVDHPAIDPWFNDILFSFKQGCPGELDCREERCCPPQLRRDVEIDYLARDFDSLGVALNDFAARYYPEWGERTPADTGVMLFDLMAALGDEFSYMQDRYALEATLETATQRRSLLRLAKMLDYVPEPGRNARCLLALTMKPMGLAAPVELLKFEDHLRFWSTPEGRSPIPFELGVSLYDKGILDVHSSWNAMPLHLPDAGEPCLPAGATELYLAPDAQNVRLPRSGPAAWKDRRMILRSRPTDPSLPERVWPITIVEVDQSPEDMLQQHDFDGDNIRLTRLSWRQEEALPFALRVSETKLHGNVAMATAGATTREEFVIGAAPQSAPADWKELPRAVERQGQQGLDCSPRPVVVIQGLEASETAGLNHFVGKEDPSDRALALLPDLILEQTGEAWGAAVSPPAWDYRTSILKADSDDRYYTLDPGMWRKIIHYDRRGERIVHRDYASGAGWSIRFGSGEYGRGPEPGDRFVATYRTLIGERSNVATHAVRTVAPLHDADVLTADAATALAKVESVDNFLSGEGAVDPESAESIRQIAPEHWKALPENAVRDAHFREIIERETWVQQAGARTRWTGSWPTQIVTADPMAEYIGDATNRDKLVNIVDAVRMAGRDFCVRDPVPLPLDLEISLCVEEGHYEGHVREAVLEAMVGAPCSDGIGFFHADNFSFGTPLRRGMLIAAVQAVPGVRGVVGICVRKRGATEWEKFDQPVLRVGVNEIIRVGNDPSAPEHGSIKVRISEEATPIGCACCAS